jgi:hypothetical protein
MELIFCYDESPFTYKIFFNYQFIQQYNFYQLLTIGMYLNDPIFHFGNVLIVDQ